MSIYIIQNYMNVFRENGRLPLRDAVEHREAPFLSVDVDHESIWIEPVAPPILRSTQNFEPKIVCRFDSRAVHRTEPFSLLPENVPDHKCTHLIYDAAILGKQYRRFRDIFYLWIFLLKLFIF